MLLIRGAMLPDFETGTTTQADVLIRDGRRLAGYLTYPLYVPKKSHI